MFEAFYSTPWHHPGIAWFFAALTLAAVLMTRPSRLGLWIFLLVEISLDAWLTGGLSPLPSSWMKPAIITFVILGDARFFYLMTRESFGESRSIVAALGVSWIIPLGSWLIHQAMPSPWGDPRWMFLVYEGMFALLAIVLLRLTTGAARALVTFELVQYATWATADVLILSGDATREAGFALRLVANFLYYAAFVPVALLVLRRMPRGAQ